MKLVACPFSRIRCFNVDSWGQKAKSNPPANGQILKLLFPQAETFIKRLEATASSPGGSTYALSLPNGQCH